MMSSLASAGRVLAAPHNSYNVRFGFSSRISRGEWRGSGAHKRFWVRVNVKPVVFWASVRQLYVSVSRQWTVICYQDVSWCFTGTQGYCILPDSIYLHTIAHMPRLLCVCVCFHVRFCVRVCLRACVCVCLCVFHDYLCHPLRRGMGHHIARRVLVDILSCCTHRQTFNLRNGILQI